MDDAFPVFFVLVHFGFGSCTIPLVNEILLMKLKSGRSIALLSTSLAYQTSQQDQGHGRRSRDSEGIARDVLPAHREPQRLKVIFPSKFLVSRDYLSALSLLLLVVLGEQSSSAGFEFEKSFHGR